MTKIVVMLVSALCLISPAKAQDAVPNEMLLQRTFYIKVGNSTGTAFTIDYDGKIYLVTARHVVKELAASNATIQFRSQDDNWKDFHPVRILFPPSDEADIAVLETDEKVSQPFAVTIPKENENAANMGQPVWFLGYPFAGLGTRSGGVRLPFIKRGTMSALDNKNPDAVVLYIDGFNNPGFSGGPILFLNYNSQKFEILGVVMGYRQESAQANVNGERVDTNILVNSGILIGYSIKHAIQAIERAGPGP
jgi:S1-C subfamily serine protease